LALLADEGELHDALARARETASYHIWTVLAEIDDNTGMTPKVPWQFSACLEYTIGWESHYSKQLSSTDYRTLDLIEKPHPRRLVEKEFKHLCQLLNTLDLSCYKVKKALAVHNPGLLTRFENFLATLTDRQRNFPKLFNRKDWINEDSGQKKFIADCLNKKISSIAWNKDNGEKVSVIPVVHETSEQAVNAICSGGFATVASLDPGWYGQGIYVTSSIKYAASYSAQAVKVIVIGYAIPGNTYPVTCLMTGTPIKPGYQSHYCLVKSNGQPYSNELGDTFFDELVLAQDVQILPKYIVYLTKNRANGSDEQQDSINNANCENQSKRPIWGADASLNGVLEAADNHNEERKQEIDEKDEQKKKKD